MRTLTIKVEDNTDGRVSCAEKKYPLEPFEAMSKEVAAEGFVNVVSQLRNELNRAGSAAAPASQQEGIAPIPPGQQSMKPVASPVPAAAKAETSPKKNLPKSVAPKAKAQ